MKKAALIGLFLLIFFLTRFSLLPREEINPDGVNWHYRTQQFVQAIKSGQFANTFQHYHPGVTVMWISGTAIEAFKQYSGITTYDQFNFESFHWVAKASVITAQLVVSLLLIFLLSKLIGFNKSILVVSLFSFEPFFVGNSRMYHLDILLTLLMFSSLVSVYLSLSRKSNVYAVLSGFLISLSFLTKSVGITVLFYVLASLAFWFFLHKDIKTGIRLGLIALASFVAVTFLVFPAMWVQPVDVISQIFSEAQRVGVRNGHEQILLGEETTNAPWYFYPLVLAMKITPFCWLGVLSFLIFSFKLKKKNFESPTVFLLIFYLFYFVFMTLPSKKIDRYMLPLFPIISYIAILGFYKAYHYINDLVKLRYYLVFVSSLLAIFIIIPLVKVFPFYFTYYSPIFQNAKTANNVIAQKPFGIGVFQLKDTILDNYYYPRLGIYDTKPMSAIYPNSKIVDVRVSGPGSYDLLILGPNEETPEKVAKSKEYKLKKLFSLYINGLEYWRVYVKEK